MIKIQRLPAPVELTPSVVVQKTALFKTDPKRHHVWKEHYIEKQLMEMSHNKCCYCECKLGVESNYLEIEHFHDKSQYPDEVVEWDNLLPSCKQCNGSKHTHDTIAYPIVNPTIDNPSEHLAFRDFSYKEKDALGRETITALNLNATETKCVPRFLVCNELMKKLEECKDEVIAISTSSGPREKNRIKNKVQELLEACQNNRAYTAVKATYITNNPDYEKLKNEMKQRGLWTPQIAQLDDSMCKYIMDKI